MNDNVTIKTLLKQFKNIMLVMLKKNKYLTTLWAVIGVLCGVLPAIIVWLNKNLVDIISDIGKSSDDKIFVFCILILGLIWIMSALKGGLSNAGNYIYAKIESGITYLVQRKFLETISKYKMETFEDSVFYNKIDMARIGLESNCLIIMEYGLNIITEIISIFSIISLLLSVNIMLPIGLLIGILPSTALIFVMKCKNHNLAVSLLEEKRKNAYVASLFSNKIAIKEINIFNTREYFLHSWKKGYAGVKNKELRLLKKEKILTSIALVVVYGSIFFISVFLIYLVDNGSITIGDYVSLITASATVQSAFMSIISNFSEIFEMSKYLNYLFELVDFKNFEDIEIKTKNKRFSSEFEKIELKNISFKYPNSQNYAVRDVSFTINKGETIAVVGYNGAGKSTLSAILLGLFRDYEGEMLWNNELVTEKNIDEYKNQITCILQNFVHYELKMRENIALGNLNKINDDYFLKKIMKEVGLDSYLEEKLEMYLSNEYLDGMELSGGQWQKLAIARALSKESDFFIFDEPTSALDPIAENRIYKLLLQIMKEKTSIIISHRLGITRYCDKIIVMEKGKIVESGNHNQLLKKKGRYYEFYSKQAKMYNMKKE